METFNCCPIFILPLSNSFAFNFQSDLFLWILFALIFKHATFHSSAVVASRGSLISTTLLVLSLSHSFANHFFRAGTFDDVCIATWRPTRDAITERNCNSTQAWESLWYRNFTICSWNAKYCIFQEACFSQTMDKWMASNMNEEMFELSTRIQLMNGRNNIRAMSAGVLVFDWARCVEFNQKIFELGLNGSHFMIRWITKFIQTKIICFKRERKTSVFVCVFVSSKFNQIEWKYKYDINRKPQFGVIGIESENKTQPISITWNDSIYKSFSILFFVLR